MSTPRTGHIVAFATLSVALGCAAPTATLTLSTADISESDSLVTRCDSDQKANLQTIAVGVDPVGGVPPPATPQHPPYRDQQTVTFVQTGKSRQGRVTCGVTNAKGASNDQKPLIVRDGRAPTIVNFDTSGAGHQVGKDFVVTMDVDDTFDPGQGVVSGIDKIVISKLGPLVISNQTIDLAGVYPGPPTAAAGPAHPIESVTATCTDEGDAKIWFIAVDASGNQARSADAAIACLP